MKQRRWLHGDCEEEYSSPYLQQFRMYRLQAGWGNGKAEPEAPFPSRQSWVQSLRYLYWYPQAFPWRYGLNGPLYIAWPQRRLRPRNQSFHGRLPAGSGWTSPEPYLPELRRWSCRRGDDIYPWYLRRYGRIYDGAYPARCLTLSWKRAHGAERA